ncbi:hypothetical protein HK102_012496, partial [Quaeritorhiza haematococci]
MTVEERTVGTVKTDTWLTYIRASGGWNFSFGLFFVLIVGQGTRVGNDLWLVQWTQNRIPSLGTGGYVGVYWAWGISQALATFLSGVFFAFAGTRAAQTLHASAAQRILLAPTSFYDTTPLGRIINRFSKDQDGIDNQIADSFRMFYNTLSVGISTFVFIIYATPWFGVPLVPLLGVYWVLQKVYRATSRELKRLDSISRSPLYAHFGETMTGLSTIRAYREESRFTSIADYHTDMTNSPYFLMLAAQ